MGEEMMNLANLPAEGDIDEAPVRSSPYEFDLLVIGGGSGGLATAKQAAELGAKVAVADFVKATPLGASWGLGGTCVNVGCIPKKMMHYAGHYGEFFQDQRNCGWELPEQSSHDWSRMVNNVQRHIQTLNWGYRVQLMDHQVTYFNLYAVFVDSHTVSLQDAGGTEKRRATSEHFVVAVGGRPLYGGFPGERECCLTSDDLFSMKEVKGPVLIVGASYISLECAGFLHAFKREVTVMVRSIFLRGFDQDMANRVAEYMGSLGVLFKRNAVPLSFSRTPEGGVSVVFTQDGEEHTELYGTVVFAIGRKASTEALNLSAVGVQVNPRNSKVATNELDCSTTDNVWAVGDAADKGLELTPVAILAGKLLAKRLFGQSTVQMDYLNVPTTVFTPLEYSACGHSEESAIAQYGSDNVDVYHTSFKPLEWTFSEQRQDTSCYAKVIVNLAAPGRVLGLHFLGPNAGEVMQGFAAALKSGLTKETLDMTVGIHPTCAEELVKADVTKRSGASANKSGC